MERRWENSQAELLPVPYRSKSLLCMRNGDADNFVDKHEAGLVKSQTGSRLPFPFFLFLLFFRCETLSCLERWLLRYGALTGLELLCM